LTTASGLDPRNRKLAVTYRPLDGLIPYAKNARTHSAEQVAEIAASIRAFGWTNPILVDGDNGVIAGHGRLLAARKLGMSEVPVIELAGMSETEKQAYIIADNKLALNAGWDRDLLALELGELDAVGFDLSLTGFGGDELAGLLNLGNPGLTDPDDVPEPPAEPVTHPGDVWVMGKHRLVCGDATNADDVAIALAGVTPHLMVTDPPYGVNYDPGWRESAGLTEGSTVAKGKVLNDDRADWREAWALFPGDVAYVWHGGPHAGTVAGSLEAAGFVIRSQIIWDKMRLVIGRGDYHWSHEPMIYCVRQGKTGHWVGRAEPDHGLADTPPQERYRPRDAEAGRVHEAADGEQLVGRPGSVRALLGVGDHHHRGGDDGSVLSGNRAEPGLCGCRRPPLAGLHRRGGRTRRRRPKLCGGCCRAERPGRPSRRCFTCRRCVRHERSRVG